MRVHYVKFLKVSPFFNAAEFLVTFVNVFGKELPPVEVTIWGDTGMTFPEWCEPYNKEICEAHTARLQLSLKSFQQNFK
ncbi:hypothetical protein [Priestia megaterium]